MKPSITEIPIPCMLIPIDIILDHKLKRYTDVTELTKDIKENGLLEPITVSKSGPTMYSVRAGHHRLQALKELGWDIAPCKVN